MIEVTLTQGAVIVAGSGTVPRDVRIVGQRGTSVGDVQSQNDGWRAEIPLRVARWTESTLPLPSGTYDIIVDDERVTGNEPKALFTDYHAELDGEGLTISSPVDPVYASADAQEALERRYVSQILSEKPSVFFESFYGRNASCNPLALDREIARVRPDVVRYWGVVDRSVAVPDGAIAVVEGSQEWWSARGEAHILIVNDWLRRRYTKRKGQRVLQTWHGTPLKRLALHRPGFDPRRALAVVRESRRWSGLLAQNPYAAKILRKAYAFFGKPLWVEGYPRNDALVTGDGAGIREQLGISPDERVLLYAPTWRDDRDEIVDFLDPVALANSANAVVLVRGHSRTYGPGRDAAGPRVIDVTGYPDTSSLLLAADALITDYSSVMFDFSVTGKPMYFLVPDIDHYRGNLRGFYFELAERAPGPLVSSEDELFEALADESVPSRYEERYRAWREVFNARDDGRAAERVVARLIDQEWLRPKTT